MNPGGQHYVAVVDDDPSVRRSFTRLLSLSGLQSVTYQSAEELLDDSKAPRFDCMVLDIHLGGMSGLQLGECLAAVRNRTPLVFITAQDDPLLMDRAVALGCAGYFRKTDPAELVLAAIRRAVGTTRT
jgi:FixJ family two-component response regulator